MLLHKVSVITESLVFMLTTASLMESVKEKVLFLTQARTSAQFIKLPGFESREEEDLPAMLVLLQNVIT